MKLPYAKLQDHLDTGKLSPVYVIAGDQDLLRELAIGRIQEHVLGTDTNPFIFERLDGEEADAASVVMSANMIPMLGGRRLVVVKRAQKMLEKAEELLAYIVDPSPRTVLILELSKKPDKRRKAWKTVEQKTTVVGCDAPKASELDDWVMEQAHEKGLRLGRDGTRYLISEFGTDLRRLQSELEKLSLYAGDEKLDLESIASVLGRGKAQNIFRFVDAVGTGRSAMALRQLGRLLDEGEPPLVVLSLLDRLVGQLRVAHELQRSGKKGGLARALGVPPYAAKSVSEAARRFDREGLTRAVHLVAETDRALKSTGLPARLVLERLTVSLCGAGRGGLSSPRAYSAYPNGG